MTARTHVAIFAAMPCRALGSVLGSALGRTLGAALLCCCAVAAYAGDSGDSSYPAVWSVGQAEGVQAPESAYYDEDSGLLFVSQMGAGGAGAKDGDGFISKMNVAGEILELKWVTGLSAPKGMRSHGGTLWVSDIDRLLGIRIATGETVHEVAVPGAKFLNDVACGEDGSVYVSDMLTGHIHRYDDGRLSVFAEGSVVEHPNGLLVQGNRLIVASWGPGIREDFSTEMPGRVFALDLDTGERTDLMGESLGNLDGLEADGRGGYIVTDWVAGLVYRIAGGKAERLMSFPKGAADIAFFPATDRLILPEMLENKITAFDLSAAFQGAGQ